MFRLVSIFKTHLLQQRSIDLKISYVRYLQTLPAAVNSILDEQSVTVSYLTNACGLSLEKAISVSKLVNIRSYDKPNSVLQLLMSHGFTKSDIATLVSRNPAVLLSDAHKNLKPKIEYFESVGIVGPDLPKFLCSNKVILWFSLKNRIVPVFEFLKGFLKTNENVIIALKQSSRVLTCNAGKLMMPNINTLRAHGVPEPLIVRLMVMKPHSLILRADSFENVVKVVKEMGFEPMSKSFILAVGSMSMLRKANWESKKESLMSFGLSENDFHLAFKKQPILVLCSVKKIRKVMDFLVKNVGLKSLDIVRCPNLLLLSLERRLIPRWSVLSFLMSKKMIRKDTSIVWSLNLSKREFEKKFVTCYMDDNPEVMKKYQAGVGRGA